MNNPPFIRFDRVYEIVWVYRYFLIDTDNPGVAGILIRVALTIEGVVHVDYAEDRRLRIWYDDDHDQQRIATILAARSQPAIDKLSNSKE